jgi:DNA polymerase
MKAVNKDGCANTGSARDFFPAKITLPQLREASKSCRGCDLYCNATQTVFGAGPSDAVLMLVGEQPGDQEDLAGKPFVGPAGRILDETLDQAGIDRSKVYVTNAVKHFKFEQRGKRRIHGKPNAREVAACRPWLEAEIEVIQPKMIVAMGATAAQALLGRDFRVTKHRGEVIGEQQWAPWVLATVHPSSLLRIPDHDARVQARADFLKDFKIVAKQLKTESSRARLRAAAREHARLMPVGNAKVIPEEHQHRRHART